MSMKHTSALECLGLSKRFNRMPVLQNLDLAVRTGECFGLVGVNGAGKTTLLKCLLDFCELDSGTIEIFSVRHNAQHARRRLAFLPERFVPPYYLTGRDFIKYMLALQHLSYSVSEVTAMLDGLDLDHSVLDKPVRAFSKGMTQKLGLAACLLSNKELTVLDEPTSGLDPKARALLKTQLRNIKDAGRTLFFTSHALADVEEICDRMAVLHEGKLLFVGTPAELCAQYQMNNLEQAFLECIKPAPEKL